MAKGGSEEIIYRSNAFNIHILRLMLLYILFQYINLFLDIQFKLLDIANHKTHHDHKWLHLGETRWKLPIYANLGKFGLCVSP